MSTPTPSPSDVWLVLGQSNAWGHKSLKSSLSSELQSSQPEIDYSWRHYDSFDASTYTGSSDWIFLQPVSSKHGCEITFGHDGKIVASNRLGVIKFTVNGSSLADHWLGGTRYAESLLYIQSVLSTYTRGYTLKGLIWVQGESDAGNATDAGNYQTNLQTIMSQFRTDLNMPNLTVVIHKLNINSAVSFLSTVRTAQENWVAGDANAEIVDTDDFAIDADGLHLLSDAEQAMGSRIVQLVYP